MIKSFLVNLLLIFGFSGVAAQDISYKTVSLLNAQYLASEKWGSIPIEGESQDVNNPDFGGKYYPPISLELQTNDLRNTIARGFMHIEADLINSTDKSLVLEQVKLLINQKYEKPENSQSMEWEIGSRASLYNPYFVIDGNKMIYIHLPNEFILAPAGERQDSRIPLDVECNEPNAIWRFSFELIFFDPADPAKKVKVVSDKAYFIASK